MNALHVSPAVAEAEANEPLGPVLGLGGRDHLVFVASLVLALAAHSSAGAPLFRSFPYLVELTHGVRKSLHERLHSQVDVEVDKPPPPPPPPPPQEKEPEPPPPAAHAAPPPPEAAAKPPAAAEAGKVLTSDPDPDEPVDLTGDGFVSGNGDRFAGGVTATRGTARTAVRSAAAAPTGTGTGEKAAPPPAPSVNLSRPAGPAPGSWDDCGWPPEADQEGINYARVLISVTVRPDGQARSVTVLKDPGYGFGAFARRCALRKTHPAALNAAGQPIEQTTPPFTVTFKR
jgi:protein TonB